MKYFIGIAILSIVTSTLLFSCKKEENVNAGVMQLSSVEIGSVQLNYPGTTANVPYNGDVVIKFSSGIDSISAINTIVLKKNTSPVSYSISFANENKTLLLKPSNSLDILSDYVLEISSSLKGLKGESFPGIQYSFTTANGLLTINAISINGQNFSPAVNVQNIPISGSQISIDFSDPIDTSLVSTTFYLSGGVPLAYSASDNNKKIQVNFGAVLNGYSTYNFSVSPDLKSATGFSFNGFTNSFSTGLDSSLKFPLISDEELLTKVQQQTFRFFYDLAHPGSGMALDRNTSGNVVTSGGSGFGVMALIVGMERGFITRNEGLTHLTKMLVFLETCDRFHGAWSHFINGNTGKAVPFSTKDDGGDLVETAFMIQGLITMRQYLKPSVQAENELIGRINALCDAVEWDWYTRGGQNVLYWHWSPNYGWDMNFRLEGYNETLITYVLAAASQTHTIPAAAYHEGYARNGAIKNGKSFYGYMLPVGFDYGGPLFFAHYSFLGLDPRNLSDAYANYWTQNVNHSLINWKHCVTNPKKYPNYNASCWGLTASDIPTGYGVSEPTNDRGVIAPTAAVSSLPYTPEQSMDAIRYFYYILGDRLWGPYGFYDAFDVSNSWWASSTLAIDQGPQVCMIENHRTGLLWDLFMSAPEVQSGLTKLGFTY